MEKILELLVSRKIGKYLSKLAKSFGAKVIISDIKKLNNINQTTLFWSLILILSQLTKL